MSGGVDLMGVGGQLLGGLSLFLYGMEKMSHGAHAWQWCCCLLLVGTG